MCLKNQTSAEKRFLLTLNTDLFVLLRWKDIEKIKHLSVHNLSLIINQPIPHTYLRSFIHNDFKLQLMQLCQLKSIGLRIPAKAINLHFYSDRNHTFFLTKFPTYCCDYFPDLLLQQVITKHSMFVLEKDQTTTSGRQNVTKSVYAYFWCLRQISSMNTLMAHIHEIKKANWQVFFLLK